MRCSASRFASDPTPMIGAHAWPEGDTTGLAGVFAAAADAFAELVAAAADGPSEQREIALAGDDRALLLVDWLNELVYLAEVDSFVPERLAAFNATQVALAGDGFSDLTFTQNIVEANAFLPLPKRLSLRLLYRYEDGRIRDWHYDGIDQNSMPANNSAYLDFGPQKYKVHFFGALFRFVL